MGRTVAIVGMGQLGRLFGAGLLALGRTVVPVRRGERIDALLEVSPELVLVAVAEDDLRTTLAQLPIALRDRVALLQNELLPPDWSAHAIEHPTVAVVWCEKKAGRPLAIVGETEIAGPHAALLVDALAKVDVPARVFEDAALESALVVKNLYILVSNLAGLAGVATVGELLGPERDLGRALAAEVLAVESARLGRSLVPDELIARMEAAFAADPAHGCRGRSSAARLARTLARARALGVATPSLDALAARGAV